MRATTTTTTTTAAVTASEERGGGGDVCGFGGVERACVGWVECIVCEALVVLILEALAPLVEDCCCDNNG
jgi:hypothetical protein